MSGYAIGQVEKLLRLPASTLRFWEKEVAFLAPRKDVFGRRVYSHADMCILARLRYLAFDRGLGIQAAARALERELGSGDQGDKAAIAEIRARMFELYADAEALGRSIDTFKEGL